MNEPINLDLCDKCGERVDHLNDVLVLEGQLGHVDPLTLLFSQRRHLFPTDTCEGSPSRAQYFPGQPRDTRGYGYHLASQILRAYAEILERHQRLSVLEPVKDRATEPAGRKPG